MPNGGPGVVPTLPTGVILTPYYTQIDAITDAQGQPTDIITPDEGNVTVSGITDAGPTTGSTVQVFLIGYQVGEGLPEEANNYDSTTAEVSATDLHETDSQGNELYSWSATLPTTGLTPGIYALQSFVHTQAFVQSNGAITPVEVYEYDQGTVTVQEFAPFTYVVHQDTEIVSVGTAQSTSAVLLPGANSTVQISTDGRYAVWTSGDQYEEDLQTGATIDLSATGASAPALATNHSPTETPVNHPDPYGPQGNGGYNAIAYPTFTEGGVTFGSTPDFDFNANNGSENPLPTVTDANGDTSVLAPFGTTPTMVGYATAASDNGNAVLVEDNSNVTYFTPYSSNGITASPQYYLVYRSPAPTLTLDPVNGSNELRASGTVTLTGTSNAIGQTVEIDFGQAGAEAGTATVLADGSWSFSFDASTLTGTSLFIEASVSSAAGTPAEVSETAQISALPLPTVTAIKGQDENDASNFGPTETLTIELDTNEAVYVTGTPTLTLSNGEVASYSGGSGTEALDFTYVPAIQDPGSSDLAVTGLNLPSGALIGDADNDALAGPFTQALGLALQTSPDITSLSPASSTSDFVTNSNTPTISVSAEVGETITVYDNGAVIGTGTTPDYGYPGITSIEITPTAPLPEGQSVLTAAAVDASGNSSPLSDPVTITVDTTPPAEHVLSLIVNGTDNVDLAHQASRSIAITGRLDAPLQPGESVVIILPNGGSLTVTPDAGVTGFSVTVDASDAMAFGVSGAVSAYVVDSAGNMGAVTNQPFTADSLRVIKLVSGDPADPSQSTEVDPAISGDGRIVAFEASQQNNQPDAVTVAAATGITAGIYLETLSTDAVTLAVAGGESPSLSNDGTILAYVDDASYPSQVDVKDLATGAVTPISANGGAAGDSESYDPSVSGDGTKVAFLSAADNLVPGVGTGQSNLQVYVATLSGDAVGSIDAITVAPSDGSQGNGTSAAVALSADGSEVAFTSDASNLLAAGDNHTGNLGGYNQQVYVKALTANAASGLQAGQVELVTGTADGTVGDGNSSGVALSADGRYVVFISAADNLAPSNLTPGTTLPADTYQVYVKDLLTGTLSLVSQTPNGVVGDFGALSATISADGKTVVFADNSDNLGAGNAGEQIYEATLSGGVVTALTVVSQPGAIPGDGSSSNPTLSSDGTVVAFQSTAENLAAGVSPGGPDPYHVYTTSITPAAPTAAPVTLTVTNTNDNGAGSLRAALAAAHDGDTIVFAPAISGGTITLESTLTIAVGVTIDGLGSNIAVSGHNAVTVFDVAVMSGFTALIEGLTIEDGAGTGAAGADAVDNGNGDPGAGAAAISYATAGAAAAGGVDLSQGVLTLLQDDFVGNVATGGAGGEGTDSSDRNAENGAAGGDAGGAIAVGTGARLFGSNLSFSDNMATGGAGGQAVDKATGGGGGAAGGAIYVGQAATVSLDGLTLDGNTAVGGVAGAGGGTGGGGGIAGGGVYVAGDATVSANGLSFSNDSATGGTGGADYGNPVGIKGSGVGGNAAGAIYVDGATSFTPFNFTYASDSAGTGSDGNGDPGGSGGGNAGNSGYRAQAFTDTNLGTASVPGPPPGSTGEDGYIVGATVSYENGSGTPATTDAVGGFTLTGGTGPIMLAGGTDSATGLAFAGTLTAPAGSTIISPLTTLVEAVAEAAGDTSAAGIASADALVLASLNLPGGVDLTTFDAEGTLFGAGLSAAAGVATALVFEADNYLESAAGLIAAAGGSAPATIAAIAQKLAAGQTLDLTTPATLFANAGLSAAATSAIVDIATATINAVQAQVDSGAAPNTVFDDISGASLADQRDATAPLTAAAQTGTDAAFQQADSSFVAALPQTLAADDTEVACFTAGTCLATPGGEVAVEQLAIGDRVVLAGGGDAPIMWIGTGRVLATRGRRNAATPVIVRRGALADNVPSRDLRITKAHGLYIAGVLIPVEFLVNHRTILWDDRAQEVDIYHIELESHDVLIANGAPAESYRDDGNRWLFQNANSGWHLPPQEPCAPVLTAGPMVDAAWRRFLDRAGPRKALPLTGDPDLHLLVDGKRVDAIERRDDMFAFRVLTHPRSARICSRVGVPQELGISRDARPLGVAVRRIVLAQPRQQCAIDADATSLVDGYHAFEPENAIRWTEGDAAVPADLFAGMNGPAMLILHLGGTTQYLDEGTAVKAA